MKYLSVLFLLSISLQLVLLTTEKAEKIETAEPAETPELAKPAEPVEPDNSLVDLDDTSSLPVHSCGLPELNISTFKSHLNTLHTKHCHLHQHFKAILFVSASLEQPLSLHFNHTCQDIRHALIANSYKDYNHTTPYLQLQCFIYRVEQEQVVGLQKQIAVRIRKHHIPAIVFLDAHNKEIEQMTSLVDSTSHPNYSKLLTKMSHFLTDMMFYKLHPLEMDTISDCGKLTRIIEHPRSQFIVFQGDYLEKKWQETITSLETILESLPGLLHHIPFYLANPASSCGYHEPRHQVNFYHGQLQSTQHYPRRVFAGDLNDLVSLQGFILSNVKRDDQFMMIHLFHWVYIQPCLVFLDTHNHLSSIAHRSMQQHLPMLEKEFKIFHHIVNRKKDNYNRHINERLMEQAGKFHNWTEHKNLKEPALLLVQLQPDQNIQRYKLVNMSTPDNILEFYNMYKLQLLQPIVLSEKGQNKYYITGNEVAEKVYRKDMDVLLVICPEYLEFCPTNVVSHTKKLIEALAKKGYKKGIHYESYMFDHDKNDLLYGVRIDGAPLFRLYSRVLKVQNSPAGHVDYPDQDINVDVKELTKWITGKLKESKKAMDQLEALESQEKQEL